MNKKLQTIENNKILELFLAVADKANAKLTMQASQREAKKFLEFIKRHGCGLANGLGEYAKYLGEMGYSAKTVNKNISLIRKRVRLTFTELKERADRGEMSNPVQMKAAMYDLEKALNGVKQKKIADKEKAVGKDKILSEEEIQKLLDGMRSGQCEKLVASPKKIALIIELLNTTGVRVNEALTIQWARMKKPRGEQEFYRVEIDGKGNKARTVMVSVDLVKRIVDEFGQGKTYLFEYGDGKHYNRSYVSDQVAKAGMLVLKRHIGAHTFRHSWATRMLKAGKSLKAVSRYLGHATTAITADMYIHDDLGWEDVNGTE